MTKEEKLKAEAEAEANKQSTEIEAVTTNDAPIRRKRERANRVYTQVVSNEETNNVLIAKRFSYNVETDTSSYKGLTNAGKEFVKLQKITANSDGEIVKSVFFNVFTDTPNFNELGILNGTVKVLLGKITKYKVGDSLNWDMDEIADSEFAMADQVILVA